MKTVVVGGGLAGLAAALDLVDAGYEVTLLEARPTLGGAVQTLPERDGDPAPPPDNGQHIALGCCTEYLGFLRRVGQGDSVRRTRLNLPVIGEDGRVGLIRPGPIALLRYRHLPYGERLGVARTARALGRLDPAEHDGETFGDVLRRLGQSDTAIERFWDVFMRPALNLPSDEASAALALFTVQTALLAGRGSSDLVVPVAPLGAMHGDAAGEALEDAGARVRLRVRVASIDGGAVLLTDGERIEADGIVLALPPAESARLLGEPEPRLDDSPIVSVHLLVDRQILRFPLAALLGSPAQWVFDRGRLLRHVPAPGQYLTVVASGVPELEEMRARELVELVVADLTGRLGRADVLWSRVSREPGATFAGRPGTAALRLPAETGRPGVVRAGAWTSTGWPATMESAVRSGRRAVEVILAERSEAAA